MAIVSSGRPPRRARSVAALREGMRNFVTPEGRARALAFAPRPDDVIIATYAKCGTTWLQQIVHGLRSGGHMDFAEITAVVPWLELAHDMGIDADAEQVARPRAFKSHLDWEHVPKGGRYINALRDPADVALSLHRFFEGWRIEPGAIDPDTFVLEFFLEREGPARYWPHVLSWWQQRAREDVLLLCYEDMLEDPAGTVARIAAFIGLDADAQPLALATRQSSLAFMRRHGRQFDDHLLREARDAACGLPPRGHTSKVASGVAGGGRRCLAPATLEALSRAWREEITERTGLGDYAAMREALGAVAAAPASALDGQQPER